MVLSCPVSKADSIRLQAQAGDQARWCSLLQRKPHNLQLSMGKSKPALRFVRLTARPGPWSQPAMRLPREELRRYIKETPFNRGEVLKLWTKFSYLDKDHSGYLALNVRWEGS